MSCAAGQELLHFRQTHFSSNVKSDPFLKKSPLDLKYVPSVYAEDDPYDSDYAGDDGVLITPSALLISIKDPSLPQVLPNTFFYSIIMLGGVNARSSISDDHLIVFVQFPMFPEYGNHLHHLKSIPDLARKREMLKHVMTKLGLETKGKLGYHLLTSRPLDDYFSEDYW